MRLLRFAIAIAIADPRNLNSVQARCIVKGEVKKSPLFWEFSWVFCSQERLFSRNSARKPLNPIKSPIFTNTPCGSMHPVCTLLKFRDFREKAMALCNATLRLQDVMEKSLAIAISSCDLRAENPFCLRNPGVLALAMPNR